MKTTTPFLRIHLFYLAAAAFLLRPAPSWGQGTPEGIRSGNYNIQQAVEFGYRHSDFTGNGSVYKTFVNLNSGPRLLEHTLQMRSLNHAGRLFDDLSLTSLGYGGDPNNFSRLRAYKNKWYNFSGMFRRDVNQWDYNLLANPLNPPESNPFVPLTTSPHRTDLTRRMTDLQLTLLPQAPLRVRLGYMRNINEGPSLSTFSEGTQILVFQDWKTSLNSYSFGVDVKYLPRTSISYDQFLQYYKGDTTWTDRTQTFRLSDDTPVDLGIIFNTLANQPCAAPIADPTTNPATVNPACNAFLVYNRAGNVRTSSPTQQLSFQSSYIPKLDLSGRLAYSSSDSDVPGYSELFEGLVTRTTQRQIFSEGPASAKRISTTADLGATWQATSKLQVLDTFHFTHFRIPGSFNLTESSLFGASLLAVPNPFIPGACPTITSPGCPTHTTNSPADAISEQLSLFLGQNSKHNLFELHYDFTQRVGGRLGYRYAHRQITRREAELSTLLFYPTLPNRGACAGQPLLPDGSCRTTTEDSEEEVTTINEHSLVLGVWARPTDAFRASFDAELFSADNAYTRISPRQWQQYRLRVHHQPLSWARLSGTINILERRNNVAEINHLQHTRSYGFSASLIPSEKWEVDFSYDFNDLFSQTNICFTGTARPPGTTACPTSVQLFQQISLYDQETHFGHFRLMLQPHARLRTGIGYEITSSTGSTLILGPHVPVGPLSSNYHRPFASFAVDLSRGFTWKAEWGYYGYNEKSPHDPSTAPRDFRGNLVTVALRYAF